MAKKMLSLLQAVLCLVLLSCGAKNEGSGSVSVDVSELFRTLSNREVSATDGRWTLEVDVSGDFSYRTKIDGKLADFKDRVVTVASIPFGSRVSLSLKVSKDGVSYYSGHSKIESIRSGQNYIEVFMERLEGSAGFNIEDADEVLSAPVIEMKTGGAQLDEPITVNANSVVTLSVSVKNAYPSDTEYLWYLNGHQIEGENGSSLEIDCSKNQYVNINNKVMVMVRYGDIMKSASIDFMISIE